MPEPVTILTLLAIGAARNLVVSLQGRRDEKLRQQAQEAEEREKTIARLEGQYWQRRKIKIINNSGTNLSVKVQIYTLSEQGQWYWTGIYSYTFKPGESCYLCNPVTNNHTHLNGKQMNIWAINSNNQTIYPAKMVNLVETPYGGQNMGEFAYTFR